MANQLGRPSNSVSHRDVVRRPQILLGQILPLLLVTTAEQHTHTHTPIYRGVREPPASELQKNHLIKLHVLKELTN